MGHDAALVSVVVQSRGRNYSFVQRQVVREAWGHLTFRLDELRSTRPDAPPLEEGAPITRIELFGGATGGDPFYVDNVRFRR
jgi:hypothetical protein